MHKRVTAIEISQGPKGTRVKFVREPGTRASHAGPTYRGLTLASCDRLDHALWRLDPGKGIEHVTTYTFPDQRKDYP